MRHRIWGAQIMIVGCGNVLFGDDGFGPAVIERLQADCRLSDEMVAVDAGTAAGEILLDALLGEETPRILIIIDAMDFGLEPGSVEEIPLEALPRNKRSDFSVHQFPAFDILRGLRDKKGVDLRLLGCQVESIPNEISQGLSAPVAGAVESTVEQIFEMICGR